MKSRNERPMPAYKARRTQQRSASAALPLAHQRSGVEAAVDDIRKRGRLAQAVLDLVHQSKLVRAR